MIMPNWLTTIMISLTQKGSRRSIHHVFYIPVAFLFASSSLMHQRVHVASVPGVLGYQYAPCTGEWKTHSSKLTLSNVVESCDLFCGLSITVLGSVSWHVIKAGKHVLMVNMLSLIRVSKQAIHTHIYICLVSFCGTSYQPEALTLALIQGKYLLISLVMLKPIFVLICILASFSPLTHIYMKSLAFQARMDYISTSKLTITPRMGCYPSIRRIPNLLILWLITSVAGRYPS